MSDVEKKPCLERAKVEVLEHIIEEWERVKQDRAIRYNSNSNYASERERAWNLREECLARTLLNSMSDIAPLIQSLIDSNKR